MAAPPGWWWSWWINDRCERWCKQLAASRTNVHGDDGHNFEDLYANLGQFPDFIRLGLIMTLERAPEAGHAASQRFLEIRQESLENLRAAFLRDYPDLDEPQANALGAMTLSQLDRSLVAAMAGDTTLTPRV